MATQSKRLKGQCALRSGNLRRSRNEKEKGKSRFRYMTETPDELCLKAEATGKLMFVMLTNSLGNTCCQLDNARFSISSHTHALSEPIHLWKS